MFIKKQRFYEMKVIAMIETYEELVEIKHNPNRPYIPGCIFLMCY